VVDGRVTPNHTCQIFKMSACKIIPDVWNLLACTQTINWMVVGEFLLS